MPHATPVLREKVIDGDLASTYESAQPERREIPSAFVRREQENPAALYDNHPPKGHHRHVEGVEEGYYVRRITGDDRWPRR
jgi:hypothetical protein